MAVNNDADYELKKYIYEMATRLKALRLFHNLDRKEFGQLVRVSDRQVARWEKGDVSPRPSKLNEIAEAFELPSTILHYGAEKEDYTNANLHIKSLYNFMDYQIKKIYEKGETEADFEREPFVESREFFIELTDLLENEEKLITVNEIVLSPEERRTLAANITMIYTP